MATLKDIKDIIKNNKSPFIYHPDIVDDDEFVKVYTKKISKDEVMADFLLRVVSRSDIFILLAIAKMSFANHSMIERTLRYISKVYPEKPIPTDIEHLKVRIDVLAKSGLIWKYKFFPVGANKQQVCFTPTATGFGFIVRILEYKHKYDNMMGITPIDKIVKYLAASDIISRMLSLKGVKKFSTYDVFYSKKNRNNYMIYGKLILENNGNKYCIIAEPLFFKYDSSRISGNENKYNIKERLNFLEVFIDNCLRSDTIPLAIIITEGYEEMIQAIQLVSGKGINDSYLSYTTSGLIHELGIKRGLLSTYIKNTEGKPQLSLKIEPAQPIFNE